MVQKIERKGEKISMFTFASVKLVGTKQSLKAFKTCQSFSLYFKFSPKKFPLIKTEVIFSLAFTIVTSIKEGLPTGLSTAYVLCNSSLKGQLQ
jgi:hypothetical protein